MESNVGKTHNLEFCGSEHNSKIIISHRRNSSFSGPQPTCHAGTRQTVFIWTFKKEWTEASWNHMGKSDVVTTDAKLVLKVFFSPEWRFSGSAGVYCNQKALQIQENLHLKPVFLLSCYFHLFILLNVIWCHVKTSAGLWQFLHKCPTKSFYLQKAVTDKKKEIRILVDFQLIDWCVICEFDATFSVVCHISVIN